MNRSAAAVRMHRRWRGRVVICICSLAFTGLTPQSALANLTPCGSSGYWQAGGNSATLVTIFGARATLSLYPPSLCDSTTISVAWVLVGADSSVTTNAAGWAQAGYGRFGANAGYPASGVHVFAEYAKWCYNDVNVCADLTDVFGGAPCNACVYSSFEKSDEYIHMYSDYVQITTTDFKPSNWWVPAWRDDFAGEVIYRQSDIPGDSNAHVHFTNLQKAISNTSDWANISQFTIAVSPTYCRFRTQYGSSGADFDIWTQPLNTSC